MYVVPELVVLSLNRLACFPDLGSSEPQPVVLNDWTNLLRLRLPPLLRKKPTPPPIYFLVHVTLVTLPKAPCAYILASACPDRVVLEISGCSITSRSKRWGCGLPARCRRPSRRRASSPSSTRAANGIFNKASCC